jgi:hypothetical protein
MAWLVAAVNEVASRVDGGSKQPLLGVGLRNCRSIRAGGAYLCLSFKSFIIFS